MSSPALDSTSDSAKRNRKYGYIKLARSIESHPFWQERRTYSRAEAWVYLLIRANWKASKAVVGSKIVTVPRGSLLTSTYSLAANWLWSRMKVSRFLTVLRSEQMVSMKPCHSATLIHIINYETYQAGDTTLDAADDAANDTANEANHKKIRKKERKCDDTPTPSKVDPKESNTIPTWIVNREGVEQQDADGLIWMSPREIETFIKKHGEKMFEHVFKRMCAYSSKNPDKWKKDNRHHYSVLNNWYASDKKEGNLP